MGGTDGQEDVRCGGRGGDLRHWQAGDTVSQMARALGLDRKTVRKYAGRAEAAGMVPGGRRSHGRSGPSRCRPGSPSSPIPVPAPRSHGEIAPFHELHRRALARRPPLATIHQRLRDEHGLTVSLASLRRYVRGELPEEAAQEQRHGAPRRSSAGRRSAARLWLPRQLDGSRTGARGASGRFIMVLAFTPPPVRAIRCCA